MLAVVLLVNYFEWIFLIGGKPLVGIYPVPLCPKIERTFWCPYLLIPLRNGRDGDYVVLDLQK